MKLQVLSKADCEQVRLWRNESFVALRTPYLLTEEQQENFYNEVVCNRNARARYWGVAAEINSEMKLIGMVGIENIEWENRRGEISIIINPEYQGAGYGEQALELLLEQGFNYLNLENIWGECYHCNPAIEFWHKFVQKHLLVSCITTIHDTKYWDGKYYGSMHFTIPREVWLKCRK